MHKIKQYRGFLQPWKSANKKQQNLRGNREPLKSELY